MLQYRFITLKWLSGPVAAADQVEHPMLDGIPFRHSRRIVGDSNPDPKFISELLQARSPLLGSDFTTLVLCLDFGEHYKPLCRSYPPT